MKLYLTTRASMIPFGSILLCLTFSWRNIKKTAFIAMVLAAELFAPSFVEAQGTLYASNLGQTPTGGAVVASDKWIAQNFTTGTNPSGYILNSIELLIDGTSGSPSGFSISIFSSLGNGVPGNNLGSLDGSDPSSGGIFTYTTSGILLSSSSSYFIVVTATTPVSQGAFEWSAANGYASVNTQWAINEDSASSANGSNWTLMDGKAAFQLGIYATAVPEPSSKMLFSFDGILLLGFGRWKMKQVA